MTDSIKSFATVDPFDGMTANSPGQLANLVNGKWDPIQDLLDGAAEVEAVAGSLAYMSGR